MRSSFLLIDHSKLWKQNVLLKVIASKSFKRTFKQIVTTLHNSKLTNQNTALVNLPFFFGDTWLPLSALLSWKLNPRSAYPANEEGTGNSESVLITLYQLSVVTTSCSVYHLTHGTKQLDAFRRRKICWTMPATSVRSFSSFSAAGESAS